MKSGREFQCAEEEAEIMGNVNAVNRIVFEGGLPTSAENCMNAATRKSLIWSTPPIGNWPGKEVNTPLKAGRATGIISPYNEKNSDNWCQGFTSRFNSMLF